MIPAFYFGVYKDQRFAVQRIAELRKFYPGSPIISIADGVADDDYAEVCRANGVLYQVGERVKIPAFGGQWTERWFKKFLQDTDSQLIIKIDPDTGVFKTLTEFPKAEVFGQHHIHINGDFHISGGAIGFTRAAVEKIINSGLLKDPVYRNKQFIYDRFGNLAREWEVKTHEAISYQDGIVVDIIKRLGLTHERWYDIFIRQNTYEINVNPSHFGFVHPCFE